MAGIERMTAGLLDTLGVEHALYTQGSMPSHSPLTGEQIAAVRIADAADTPETSLDRSNVRAILRACIAKLSPAHREIINLVYYHEKTVEEAGEIIGIPQSTVKTRMFYARKQLAELLKGCGVDTLAA